MGILTAIAVVSPALAAHALVGSLTGTLVGGLAYGAPASELAAGLWGYNSALTSLGVAVFFRPTVHSRALSVGGAAVTASVFAALQTAGGLFGTPCLTLPFCITMSVCYLLGTKPRTTTSATSGDISEPLIPGLWLATHPHSPEQNAQEAKV